MLAKQETNCHQPLDPQTNIVSTRITGTRSSIKLRAELWLQNSEIAKKELKYANHFRKSELTLFFYFFFFVIIAIYSNQPGSQLHKLTFQMCLNVFECFHSFREIIFIVNDVVFFRREVTVVYGLFFAVSQFVGSRVESWVSNGLDWFTESHGINWNDLIIANLIFVAFQKIFF